MPFNLEPSVFRRLSGSQTSAFILGDLTSHALGYIRSLGRRGIPTIAIASNKAPRSRSRYCLRYYTIADDSERLAFLTSAGGLMSKKAALLPTSDGDVLFMSRNRDALSKNFLFVLPPADLLERLANKRSQYQYAEGIGIPVPQTLCPKGAADIEEVAKAIPFPCVMKPAYSHIWRARRSETDDWRWLKAIQIDTPEQLHSVYQKVCHYGVDLLVQERVEGPETGYYSLYAYFNRESKPLASCVIQKQRQWPPVYGTGSFSMTCEQDQVMELGMKLLKGIDYQGMANIEFKHDRREGVFKLIELNVRGGGRVALAVAAGVDFPYIAYRDAIGEAVEPTHKYEPGLTWVNLTHDFAAYWSYYRKVEALSWRRWMREIWNVHSHAFFARDDPVPVIGQFGKVIKGGAKLIYGKLGERLRLRGAPPGR
jgi:D-aspartate ligase